MSNDVTVTGNLIVEGTYNIPDTSNIINGNGFTITNTIGTGAKFLVSTGTGTAAWSELLGKHFSSYQVTSNANVTLTGDDNVFQSLEGNGGTYSVTLPVGGFYNRGTQFFLSKVNSTNTYEIYNGPGDNIYTINGNVSTETVLFVGNYPNSWCWFVNTGAF